MELFDVYPRYKVSIERAKGAQLFDANNQEYLDLYGGHGVISVGHSHPHYVKSLQDQIAKLGFYSNSVHLPLQEQLAQALGEVSGYPEYQLFLCNSGAEAIENALKLASFHTKKTSVLAFEGSFHGRTAAAVNVTYHMKQRAPINVDNFEVVYVPLNDKLAVELAFSQYDFAAVIVEGIQGVGGLDFPSQPFLKYLREKCNEHDSILIVDEIQSGYGRTGKFFAHQFADIKADIVTIAKGMGNGFPVAGVVITPQISASYGLLGTTFGGNPLACAAALSVLEILKEEELVGRAGALGEWLKTELLQVPNVQKVKGKGLMLGVEFDFPIAELRSKLLYEKQLFTGDSANPNVLRILPPLTISKVELMEFVNALIELVA